MKTPKNSIRHFDRLRRRTVQFVRWNLPVLVMTGLSLFFLKCEGTSPDAKTLLVPLLVSADSSASTAFGGNQGGQTGNETPIAVDDIPQAVAPTLNEITYITNDANPADDPYSTKGLLQFQKTSVSFKKPVPSNTTITLYFGKKNMELQPDGTVTNALVTLNRTAATFSGYTYLTDADKKVKVFVVAKNEFGISTKQLTIGHPRICADAPKIPATFGDCNDHCIEATKTGSIVELNAKYKLPIQGTSLNLDIVGVSPRSFPEYIAPSQNLVIPVPNAGIHTIKTNFNIYDKEFLCAKVTSLLVIDNPMRFTIANGYLSIPND
ncbi:hypothetical protein EHQ24_00360 [Leptospira noumeaensis]|uniref:Uncharacterized protein n=2 Tax=Leptospira noumeaensis TaxID=2484964 RepID=A0A4R9IH11_9LEPT|nr:hypothetical protein EHQ24_00360 [Leptospira noumeaensis]